MVKGIAEQRTSRYRREAAPQQELSSPLFPPPHPVDLLHDPAHAGRHPRIEGTFFDATQTCGW